MRAGVVARAQDSDWSSHRSYLGLAPCPPWLATEAVLGTNEPNENSLRRDLASFALGKRFGNDSGRFHTTRHQRGHHQRRRGRRPVGRSGNVRQDRHTGVGPKRTVCGQRFGVEHVEDRVVEMATIEMLDQGRRVDDRPTGKVDQAVVGYAQSAYYEELLAAGVKIFIYPKAMLHAKHMSIDTEIVLIGSGNMDRRSFDLNFEISMIFYDEQVTQNLRAEETRYMAFSEQLDIDVWRQRSAKEKFLQNSAKLVSPLL